MSKLSYNHDPGSTLIIFYACIKITQEYNIFFMSVNNRVNYVIFL